MGRIEINGVNSEFREASSRDGGLVRTPAYYSLREFFEAHVLKRLEKYAVDIVKYGNIGEDFYSALQQKSDIKSKIMGLVQTLTKSENVIDIQYDPSVVNILEELSEKSLRGVLKNFKRIASNNSSKELEKEVLKAEVRLTQLETARIEAEKEAEKAKREKEAAEKAAQIEIEKAREAQLKAEEAARVSETKTTENIFLRSLVSKDVENVVSFHHHIGIAAQTIENYIRTFRKRITKGKSYSEETILTSLENISLQTRKIISTTRLATKANFHLEGSKVEKDLVEYISEYILNICAGVIKTTKNKNMIFEWVNKSNIEFFRKFRPLEIAIILDNLISNSIKAGSTKVFVGVNLSNDGNLIVKFSDNGRGIGKSGLKKVFDLAYTTTDGSGLGLTHTKKMVEEMRGSIFLSSEQPEKGAEFTLEFLK